MRGIHRLLVNSPHKGQWRGASFDLRLNKRLSKQSWGWWFETPSRPLWRHCNGKLANSSITQYTVTREWSYFILILSYLRYTGPVAKIFVSILVLSLHNEPDGVWNHRPFHYLPNRLFRRRSKKTSKLRVTGLCGGNSPVTGEFPAQRASDAENVSIWWRHHDNEDVPLLNIFCWMI